MITSLTLVDNFFRDESDFLSIPGKRLFEFGELVREYWQNSSFPDGHVKTGAKYIGGWPSASFMERSAGELLGTALLFESQVVVRDPIADWFGYHQYRNSHKMGAIPGWLDPETDTMRVVETRWFLHQFVPALRAYRKLVETGIILLVPTESVILDKNQQVAELQEGLSRRLLTEPLALAAKFAPQELAVEHNMRGVFLFAGGEWEAQTRRYFDDALKHFAREYVVASHYQATYTAPFPWETFLCELGLGATLRPDNRVHIGMFKSGIPLFSGLTPDVLARIHSEDSVGQLRADLFETYSDLPLNMSNHELQSYIEDREKTLLQPKIEEAQSLSTQGRWARMGVGLSQVKFSMLAGVWEVISAVQADGSHAGYVPGVLMAGALMDVAEGVRKSRRTPWTALVKHQRSVDQEIMDVEMRDPSEGASSTGHPWGIPEHPSLDVTLSRGMVRLPWMPMALPAQVQPGTVYQEGIYRACECESGRAYKFCCRGLPKRLWPPNIL